MKCRQGGGEHLARYLAGELRPGARARLEAHLATCPDCARELAELRRLERLLGQMTAPPPPAGLATATLRRAHEVLPAAKPTRTPAFAPWLAGTAALAAVLLAVVLLPHGRPGEIAPGAPPVTIAGTGTSVPTPGPTVATPVAPPVRVAAVAPPARIAEPHHASRRTTHQRFLATTTARPAIQPETGPSAEQYLRQAAAYSRSGDVDLEFAALENAAVAHPNSPTAARALLAAAELKRAAGQANEAEAVYHRVLSQPSSPLLVQALAHRALGDLRRDAAGDDALARGHYQAAALALTAQARKSRAADRAKALIALGEVEETLGHAEKAVAAYAEAAISGPTVRQAEDTTAHLAQVL